jgi:hypothetical protein
MEFLGLGKKADIILNWALRVCVALLTYMGVEILDRINTTSAQTNDLSGKIIEVSADMQIIRHDLNSVEKRMDRIETSIEKIKDQK